MAMNKGWMIIDYCDIHECDDFDDTLHMLIVMTPNLIQRGQQLLKFDSFDICNTKFDPDGTKTFKV